MKKLLIAVTAAASAFGLYAADAGFVSGTSFDDDGMVGINTIGALNGKDGNAWSTNDGEASLEVKAYTSDEMPDESDRPVQWSGGITEKNYLGVKTKLDKALTRTLATSMDLSTGDAYVDTLVKFTACDEEITTLADGSAKLAVWVKEDETSGKTNLMVTAGYIAGQDGSVSQKNYDCGTFTGLDSWHRLTIKSIGDITANKALVGFVVFIDQDPVRVVDGIIGFDGYKDLLTPVATLWDKAGNLFPSLQGINDGTISAIALSGQGGIDDISFTTATPFDGAEKGTVTFTWTPADFTAIAIGNETVDVTKGSYVCEYVAGQTYSISATPVKGKMVTSASSFTPDAAGKSFVITTAPVAATVTIDGAPTEYTDLAAAISAVNAASTAVTLKLGNDVEGGIELACNAATLTIDIAGKTITASGDGMCAILNDGTANLVIIDTVGGGLVEGANSAFSVDGGTGTVTLNGGTFKGQTYGVGVVALGVKCDATAKDTITLADDQQWSDADEDGLYTVIEKQKTGWAIYLAEGATENEFLVQDEKDLQALAAHVAEIPTAGITFTQTKDLDLAGIAWPGIGAANNKDNLGTEATYKAGAFQGTYDGGNFTVSNITLSREDYIGFFGSLYGATVKNLKLSAAGDGFAKNGSAVEYSGALAVGVSVKSTIENVETLEVEGTFTAVKAAAGIVGYAAGGTVLKGCVNKLNVTSTSNEKVAGLVACAQNSGSYTPAYVVIDGCSNEGNVECKASGKTRAALLVSYTDCEVKFQGTITARGTVTQAGSTENIQSIININGGSATVVDGAVITAPAGMKSTIHNSKAHAGLNFATVANDVATFVADSAATVDGANLKVMTTGNTITLANIGESITLDTTLATATVTTSAENAEVKQDGNVYTVVEKPSGVVPGEPVGLGNPGSMTLEQAQEAASKLSPVPTAEQTEDGITAADLQVKAVLNNGAWQAVAEPADKHIPEVKTEGEDVQPIEVTATDFSATIKNAKKGFYYGFVAADELKADVEFAPAATFEKATADGALKLTAPKATEGNARFYKLSVSAVPVTVGEE